MKGMYLPFIKLPDILPFFCTTPKFSQQGGKTSGWNSVHRKRVISWAEHGQNHKLQKMFFLVRLTKRSTEESARNGYCQIVIMNFIYTGDVNHVITKAMGQ
jgi:hypothetical protein